MVHFCPLKETDCSNPFVILYYTPFTFILETNVYAQSLPAGVRGT